MSVPLQVVRGRFTLMTEPGLNVHDRSFIDDEAYAAYSSLQLPAGVEVTLAPWLSLGMHTGYWTGSHAAIIPTYASVRATIGHHVDVRAVAGVQERKPRYLDWERTTYAGLTLTLRLDTR